MICDARDFWFVYVFTGYNCSQALVTFTPHSPFVLLMDSHCLQICESVYQIILCNTTATMKGEIERGREREREKERKRKRERERKRGKKERGRERENVIAILHRK